MRVARGEPVRRAFCPRWAGFCRCTPASGVCGEGKCRQSSEEEHERTVTVEGQAASAAAAALPSAGCCFVTARHANKEELVQYRHASAHYSTLKHNRPPVKNCRATYYFMF